MGAGQTGHRRRSGQRGLVEEDLDVGVEDAGESIPAVAGDRDRDRTKIHAAPASSAWASRRMVVRSRPSARMISMAEATMPALVSAGFAGRSLGFIKVRNSISIQLSITNMFVKVKYVANMFVDEYRACR